MAWTLEGEEHLAERLATEPDKDLQDHVLAWLITLATDPLAVEGERVPGHRANVVAVIVPGTRVAVTFLAVEQFRVVRLREVRTF